MCTTALCYQPACIPHCSATNLHVNHIAVLLTLHVYHTDVQSIYMGTILLCYQHPFTTLLCYLIARVPYCCGILFARVGTILPCYLSVRVPFCYATNPHLYHIDVLSHCMITILLCYWSAAKVRGYQRLCYQSAKVPPAMVSNSMETSQNVVLSISWRVPYCFGIYSYLQGYKTAVTIVPECKGTILLWYQTGKVPTKLSC